MSTFNIDLAVIRPDKGDVIVAQLDTRDIPFCDIEDFSDAIERLAEAFPDNKVVVMSKDDHIYRIQKGSPEKVLKVIAQSAKCPVCGLKLKNHEIKAVCPIREKR